MELPKTLFILSLHLQTESPLICSLPPINENQHSDDRGERDCQGVWSADGEIQTVRARLIHLDRTSLVIRGEYGDFLCRVTINWFLTFDKLFTYLSLPSRIDVTCGAIFTTRLLYHSCRRTRHAFRFGRKRNHVSSTIWLATLRLEHLFVLVDLDAPA